jgi:uncharacterized protein YifE (UPF0438 family)
MTAIEKETLIQWNDEEDFVTVYTCHPKIMRKMERLHAKVIDRVKVDKKLWSIQYQVPKKGIAIGLNPRRATSNYAKAQKETESKVSM